MAALHPESKALIDMFKGSSLIPEDDQDNIEKIRKDKVAVHQKLAGDFEYQGEVSETTIPSDSVKDGIPVTVYKPSARADSKQTRKPAILVYFHGGGWVFGSRKTSDRACRIISARANAIVVNVEYRLAPENKFPAWMDDVETAVKWVIQNKLLIGGQPDSAVGVAGDSAGGTMSASVCHTVSGIDFQILIYPYFDLTNTLETYKTYAKGYLLSQTDMDWFHSKIITSEGIRTDPRFSPLYRDSFTGLPPALFIVAECDMLSQDSFEYAKKLSAAGVRNEILLIPGAIHLFYTLPGHFKELCEKAYSRVVDFINEMS